MKLIRFQGRWSDDNMGPASITLAVPVGEIKFVHGDAYKTYLTLEHCPADHGDADFVADEPIMHVLARLKRI